MSCRHLCLRTAFCLLLAALALPLACAAQSVPAPRVVELTAPDRIILKATYFGAAQPGPGILLLHKCNRQRRVWDDLAAQLAAAGLNVLTVDFRGYGESCGVNQAVQLARRHAEVKSLVLLSESTDRAGRKFLHNSPNLPLFLAAADDDPDPGVVEMMHWLYDVSPDLANKFVHYSVGGHGVEMFAAHKELPGMIVEWYNATLRNSPA